MNFVVAASYWSICQVEPLKQYSKEELESVTSDELSQQSHMIGEKLRASKPNHAAIAEYKRKEEVKSNDE